MNITDLMTENGRKGYEGEPRNILVFGLCNNFRTGGRKVPESFAFRPYKPQGKDGKWQRSGVLEGKVIVEIQTG